jgi:hypothetical protein
MDINGNAVVIVFSPRVPSKPSVSLLVGCAKTLELDMKISALKNILFLFIIQYLANIRNSNSFIVSVISK